MEDIAEITRQNRNLIQNTAGVIASIGLAELGKKLAGNIVTPATWALNYTTSDVTPGKEDAMIYTAGLVSLPASVAVGTIKALVDDKTQKQLEAVRRKESAKYRKFIQSCSYLGWANAPTTAMKIANAGGTAWKAYNGLWCYITDAKGRHVCDFRPNSFLELYQPSQPLAEGSNGGFEWGVIRG